MFLVFFSIVRAKGGRRLYTCRDFVLDIARVRATGRATALPQPAIKQAAPHRSWKEKQTSLPVRPSTSCLFALGFATCCCNWDFDSRHCLSTAVVGLSIPTGMSFPD